jgi:hypothetical protein
MDKAELINLTPSAIDMITQHKNGVRIQYKDGSFYFVDNAEFDGDSLTIHPKTKQTEE